MEKVFNSLWIAVLYFIALTSCQSQSDTLVENSSALSRLQDKLLVDPVFKTYRKAFKEQLSLALSQRYSSQYLNKEILTGGMKDVHSKEDYFRLCQKAGIVDAQKQYNTHYKLLDAQKKLYDKYPEIQKMSRDGFRKLMLKFDQEEVRLILRTSK
jgi:hypothetical protein